MKAKLLGVVGSLRRDSLTRHAVKYVLDHAQKRGAEVKLLDLFETPLPFLKPDDRRNPEYLQALEQVSWANCYLLGSPDYHGGMSGVMKNFLDHFWKEFGGKLFGYVCASHEKGLTAMDQMRVAVRQCYGWSLPYGASTTDGDFDSSWNIVNSNLSKRLETMAYDMTTYAPILRAQFESDVASSETNAGFAMHYRPRK